MALTIVVGYTGIPVYKMICTEDGHTVVSLSEEADDCHHKAVLDCCTPKHIKQNAPVESCCASSSNFFKLNESTEVHKQQNETGHLLTAITALFAPLNLQTYTSEVIATSSAAPPLLSRKQPAQSFIQVYLI
jgi:cytochrome c oxidase assembly protein Cox11